MFWTCFVNVMFSMIYVRIDYLSVTVRACDDDGDDIWIQPIKYIFIAHLIYYMFTAARSGLYCYKTTQHDSATGVNKILKTLTSRDSSIDFIELTASFTHTKGKTIKVLYDTNDYTCIHLGQNIKENHF